METDDVYKCLIGIKKKIMILCYLIWAFINTEISQNCIELEVFD